MRHCGQAEQVLAVLLVATQCTKHTRRGTHQPCAPGHLRKRSLDRRSATVCRREDAELRVGCAQGASASAQSLPRGLFPPHPPSLGHPTTPASGAGLVIAIASSQAVSIASGGHLSAWRPASGAACSKTTSMGRRVGLSGTAARSLIEARVSISGNGLRLLSKLWYGMSNRSAKLAGQRAAHNSKVSPTPCAGDLIHALSRCSSRLQARARYTCRHTVLARQCKPAARRPCLTSSLRASKHAYHAPSAGEAGDGTKGRVRHGQLLIFCVQVCRKADEADALTAAAEARAHTHTWLRASRPHLCSSVDPPGSAPSNLGHVPGHYPVRSSAPRAACPSCAARAMTLTNGRRT